MPPKNARMMVPASDSAHDKHLFLIDGYGFLFRAYHSMPPLTRPDGTPVGAVYGFTNMLIKLRREIEQSNAKHAAEHYMVILFDPGTPSFRTEIYPEYKANRPPAPEDLLPQFPLVREAAEALAIPTIEMPRYEADDLIATYATQAAKEGAHVTIVSSDKDLMQLVSPQIQMYDAMKNRDITAKQVEEKFGVGPEKLQDVLALMGDSSDNIPGVPGIGPKTAAELIHTFGSLEGVLAGAESIKQQKRRESLLENADKAKLSYDLVQLCDSVPITQAFTEFTMRDIDAHSLSAFLQEQGFTSLLNKVEAITGQKPPAVPTNTPPKQSPKEHASELITTTAQLTAWVAEAHSSSTLAALLIEEKDTVLGLALSHAPGHSCYIPLGSEAQTADLLDDAPPTIGLPAASILEILTPLLTHPAIITIGHDIKPLLHLCLDHAITVTPLDDVMVMSYVTHGSTHKHNLETLASLHDLPLTPPEALQEKKTTLATLPTEELAAYAGARASTLLALHSILRQQLFAEHMLTVYETLERPLIAVLAAMEHHGILADPKKLHHLSEEFATRIATEEKAIFAIAGHEFNVASPKQLGEVLFDELQLPGGKKSKKAGTYVTSSDVLDELATSGHTIADHILQYRMLSKLKSTYTDALATQINPTTKRIHTRFAMTVANTGRLSSHDPNLQNIPIRSEEGRQIRTAFIAAPGHQLISADYSQIELRLLAHIADISTLKTAFAEGQDIHAITASQVFGIPLEEVDANHRRRAKAINFGIIYGQSAFGLANALRISRDEAKQYIAAYFERYPGIRAYLEETKTFAHSHGYVTTLFGRKCFVPQINAKGPARAFAERAAINAPLQGSGADIIKRAMIRVPEALEQQSLSARLLLQIHDELIVEVPEDQVTATSELLINTMQSAATLDVPLVVEATAGTHWGEIH